MTYNGIMAKTTTHTEENASDFHHLKGHLVLSGNQYGSADAETLFEQLYQ